MRSQLPPICKLAMRLLVAMEQSVLRFSRAHRYSVGADLREQAMQAARLAHQAWRERGRQLQRVRELVAAVDNLKLTMQLASDVGAFRSFGEFEALARIASDLGRQCGGWQKALYAAGQNGRGVSPAQRTPTLSSRSASYEAAP